MIILENEVYKIKNWNKYQSIETYEKYKEQGRLRQQRYREKLKSENGKSNVIERYVTEKKRIKKI